MAEDPGALPVVAPKTVEELAAYERARQTGARATNMCPACQEPLTAVYDDQVLDTVALWRQL